MTKKMSNAELYAENDELGFPRYKVVTENDQSLGSRITNKLDTCRWHVLRIIFADNRPQAETYEEVMAAKTVTANAAKKLVGKSWCARRIVWDNGQAGIAADIGDTGYYILMPAAAIAEKTMLQANVPPPTGTVRIEAHIPGLELDNRDVNSFVAVLNENDHWHDSFDGHRLTIHEMLRTVAEVNARRAEFNMRAIIDAEETGTPFTSVEDLLVASQRLRLDDLAAQPAENFRPLAPAAINTKG
jgi:hypothetical protein